MTLRYERPGVCRLNRKRNRNESSRKYTLTEKGKKIAKQLKEMIKMLEQT